MKAVDDNYKIIKVVAEENKSNVEKLLSNSENLREKYANLNGIYHEDLQRITSLEEQLRSKRFGNPGEIEIGREYWKSMFNPNKK